MSFTPRNRSSHPHRLPGRAALILSLLAAGAALAANYQNTVLTAYSEVESAMVAYAQARKQVTFYQRSVDAASKAARNEHQNLQILIPLFLLFLPFLLFCSFEFSCRFLFLFLVLLLLIFV